MVGGVFYMETNFKGRLRNTRLPSSHVLMPLFEAVINSIHAIEDSDISLADGKIHIEVIREENEQLKFSQDIQTELGIPIEFRIIDNGIGFTEKNMTSFNELDSTYKQKRGGHGVGRLLWLKAFHSVTIESIFKENEIFYSRTFCFDEDNGIHKMAISDAPSNSTTRTIVSLKKIYDKFKKYINKKIETIAREIFEHCIGYYLDSEIIPSITIQDKNGIISLNDIYDQNLSNSLFIEILDIKGQKFRLAHARLRKASISPKIYYCVNQRSVRNIDLTKRITGFFGNFEDEHGVFHYACYVTSTFFDENLRSERTEFDIAERNEGIFQDLDLSFEEIDRDIIKNIEQHLAPYLEKSREISYQRTIEFINYKAPHYRPILKRMQKKNLYLSPSCSERDIELALHQETARIEEEILFAEQQIDAKIDSDNYNEEDFNKDIEVISDFQKSNLVRYVAHRNYVLKILKNLIMRTKDGKYEKESMIHQLIMPMGKDSEDVTSDESNLWIIDEKLAFHHYLSSDKSLLSVPITGSKSRKEPDILKIDFFDKPAWVSNSQSGSLSAITIVEFKRPMRDGMKEDEDDPIKQMREYLKLIRNGKIMFPNGRPVPNSNNIPGFCYAICDITPSMKDICINYDLKPTYDGMGYFGYQTNLLMYIEVISYDKLLQDAIQRNQAFFQKLGLSSSI